MNPSTLQTQAETLSLSFIESRSNPQTSSPSLTSQMQHRLRLVSFWDIRPGSRVLEIGCGQGDTTVVLADAVGETGRVDAIDPGSLDYGSPQTLGEAQQHILSSPLGSRVTFHTPMDPITYLDGYKGPKYDYVVLSHCIYYFSHPSSLPTLIRSLTPHTKKLCIAEWSLSPSFSNPSFSTPHILAALLFTYLESLRQVSSSNNIRTALSPRQIEGAVLGLSSKKEDGNGNGNGLGSKEGKGVFILERENVLDTDEGMQDGYWEVKDLLSKGRREGILGEVFKMKDRDGKERDREEKGRAVAEAMFDALQSATDAVGGVEKVRCMGVWVGVFGLSEG